MLAHCLYVLTDDNFPAIADIRADAGYLTCLLGIVQSDEMWSGKGKVLCDQRSVMLGVLVAGRSCTMATTIVNFNTLIGILRNISPIPPLFQASSIDIDKGIVLPLLQPVITSISLLDVSNAAQQLVTQEVLLATTDRPGRHLINAS